MSTHYTTKQPSGGYVYLVRMGDTHYYKIGIAKTDPQNRLSGLQVSTPIELSLVAAYLVNRYMTLEQELHQALAYCHVRGEWFRDTDGDVLRTFHEYATMALADALLDEEVSVSAKPRMSYTRRPNKTTCAKCKKEVAWATPSEAGTIRRWGCESCRAKSSK